MMANYVLIGSLVFIFGATVTATEAMAQDFRPGGAGIDAGGDLSGSPNAGLAPQSAPATATAPGAVEGDREPASAANPSVLKKRPYPGGADEDELRVQTLPEATIRTDHRTVEHDVFKQLYNQELKQDQQNDVEE